MLTTDPIAPRLVPLEAPPYCPPMGIDTTPEEWAVAHRALLPGPAHHVDVSPWGAICACGCLWSRDPAKGGEVRNRPMPIVVMVGDTFTRCGDEGGPWEAVQDNGGGRWLLRRGGDQAHTTAERLLTPALWLRARAL